VVVVLIVVSCFILGILFGLGLDLPHGGPQCKCCLSYCHREVVYECNLLIIYLRFLN